MAECDHESTIIGDDFRKTGNINHLVTILNLQEPSPQKSAKDALFFIFS